MQFVSNLTGDNGVLFWLLGLAGILVVVLLVVLLVRLLLGARLRGGARSRQPRLGVVDAYDLDRHRQLVIVRRDNVEHLLMIGGPNDLLVEGGSATATAFLTADLVDRILIYRAPIIVGEGKSSFGYVGLDAIADAHGLWVPRNGGRLGVDRLEVYERVR